MEQVEPGTEASPETELDPLRREVERQASLAGEYLEHLQRLQADFENFRKRTARDREAAVSVAVRELLTGFLPVVDSIELAVASAAGNEAIGSGLELVCKQVRDWLGQAGVWAIEVDGQQFDPATAEPIMVVEDDSPAGTVIQTHRKGYQARSYLLRPAMVTVSRGSGEQGGNTDGGGDDE